MPKNLEKKKMDIKRDFIMKFNFVKDWLNKGIEEEKELASLNH